MTAEQLALAEALARKRVADGVLEGTTFHTDRALLAALERVRVVEGALQQIIGACGWRDINRFDVERIARAALNPPSATTGQET